MYNVDEFEKLIFRSRLNFTRQNEWESPLRGSESSQKIEICARDLSMILNRPIQLQRHLMNVEFDCFHDHELCRMNILRTLIENKARRLHVVTINFLFF